MYKKYNIIYILSFSFLDFFHHYISQIHKLIG